jgi:hypothetical protein
MVPRPPDVRALAVVHHQPRVGRAQQRQDAHPPPPLRVAPARGVSVLDVIEAPWLVNGEHGASLRHHKVLYIS